MHGTFCLPWLWCLRCCIVPLRCPASVLQALIAGVRPLCMLQLTVGCSSACTRIIFRDSCCAVLPLLVIRRVPRWPGDRTRGLRNCGCLLCTSWLLVQGECIAIAAANDYCCTSEHLPASTDDIQLRVHEMTCCWCDIIKKHSWMWSTTSRTAHTTASMTVCQARSAVWCVC